VTHTTNNARYAALQQERKTHKTAHAMTTKQLLHAMATKQLLHAMATKQVLHAMATKQVLHAICPGVRETAKKVTPKKCEHFCTLALNGVGPSHIRLAQSK
jgi:hypothetical protein